ncbi:DUF4328 domain-containing protein [Qipengyuania aurantiaca]|uniref:DUF4328 domain-containing protein n=1 Tax=Qipengyuania aurantiaca TaxID=2867233 RepID=A0ABX8ZM01_9SPHN|nr:DUF4328 domain-containing protein [Qipengyuania aurantiaca]QZD90038.1 DUF4328 domain-containing protein [Qipengyuania aurantiaca]
MNTEKKLRSLRTRSLVVTVFALLLVASGLTQLGFGGVAIGEEYERIEKLEELTRQRTFYGYQSQQAAFQNEYNRSSSAFFLQGRFLSATQNTSWTDPGVIAFGANLLSGLGFLVAAMMWVWRAHANLTEAGVRAKFTPGRALAAYLLPVANLILPFEAMRELYNRSHHEPEDFVDSTVEDVTAWFTALVVGLLIFSAMLVKFILDAGTALIIMTPLWMEFAILAFAMILILGAAWLFAGLARKITAAQEEFLPEIVVTAPEQEAPQRMSVNVLSA